MARVVIFDPNATPQRVLQVLDSVSSPDFAGRNDVVIEPDLSLVQASGFTSLYWKHETGAIVAMTAGERSALDAQILEALTLSVRDRGKAIVDALSDSGILQRALADIVKDELNILRGWIVSFKSEVALAITLADLKVRVAALPDLPDRTLSQLRTAIKNRIDSGSVDA